MTLIPCIKNVNSHIFCGCWIRLCRVFELLVFNLQYHLDHTESLDQILISAWSIWPCTKYAIYTIDHAWDRFLLSVYVYLRNNYVARFILFLDLGVRILNNCISTLRLKRVLSNIEVSVCGNLPKIISEKQTSISKRLYYYCDTN